MKHFLAEDSEPLRIISHRYGGSAPTFRQTWFHRRRRRGFKTGGGGDSSVDGKIDHYRFNEAKWTAFRFPFIISSLPNKETN